jgi:hypothetical protein
MPLKKIIVFRNVADLETLIITFGLTFLTS